MFFDWAIMLIELAIVRSMRIRLRMDVFTAPACIVPVRYNYTTGKVMVIQVKFTQTIR